MVWLFVVVLGLAALGLGILAAVADLDTTAQIATVAGSVGGLAAAAVSGYALLRPPAAPEAHPPRRRREHGRSRPAAASDGPLPAIVPASRSAL